MRVCDYIADEIYKAGAKDVFLVTGGGMMFLTDGLASHPKINAIPCHHEQAAAMAAVGYAKYNGFGSAFVTTGCGGTNTVTGVLHAYQDSTPCVFVSGQCATNEIIQSAPAPLRQFGMQEADIVSIVKPITKYAVTLKETESVVYEIEKALYLAKEGRPGPVWIDVPLDIQQAELEGIAQRHFPIPDQDKPLCTDDELCSIAESLKNAERPLIIAGQGIRLSGAVELFGRFIEEYQIPFVYSRLGFDVYPNGKDLSIGCIGIRGTRAGNFAVANADFILVLGSRLSINSTGYNSDLFAREARVCVVDVDENEHKKNTIRIDQFICSDVKYFLEHIPALDRGKYSEWVSICKNWKNKYPACTAECYDDRHGISLYAFTNEMSKYLDEDAAVVTDAGSTCYVVPQSMKFLYDGQRYMPSGAQAEMGYTLPAVIGTCFARGKKSTIGIVGDGSLQMNIQELQTVKHHDLPIKLFVWNNDGYMSIRGAQKGRFSGRYLGSGRASGVTLPSLDKICYAYGIDYVRLENLAQIDEIMKRVMRVTHPIICEVMCRPDEWILCTWSRRTLENGDVIRMPNEDMVPLLDREEFYNNMIVKPVS